MDKSVIGICGYSTFSHLKVKEIMRTIFPFYLFTVILFSCNNHERKGHFDSFDQIDTTCKHDVNSAKTDLSNGKWVYCHFAEMLDQPFRNESELILLLKKYNINYRVENISDVVTDQSQKCYCDFMREKINDRYGNKFIDSLMDKSDSIFLVNNINDTFLYTNCDTRAHYPNDPYSNNTEGSETLQEHIDSLIKYPEGYHKRTKPDMTAYVQVYFVVNKTGEAKITQYQFLFDIESNNKYQAYFERQIEKRVKTKGWTPATIRKQKVNSEYPFRIYFE